MDANKPSTTAAIDLAKQARGQIENVMSHLNAFPMGRREEIMQRWLYTVEEIERLLGVLVGAETIQAADDGR